MENLDVIDLTAAPKIRRAGCQGHRGLESRRIVVRNGLRVVSPEDTWCDLAASGTLDLDELNVVITDRASGTVRRLRRILGLT